MTSKRNWRLSTVAQNVLYDYHTHIRDLRRCTSGHRPWSSQVKLVHQDSDVSNLRAPENYLGLNGASASTLRQRCAYALVSPQPRSYFYLSSLTLKTSCWKRVSASWRFPLSPFLRSVMAPWQVKLSVCLGHLKSESTISANTILEIFSEVSTRIGKFPNMRRWPRQVQRSNLQWYRIHPRNAVTSEGNGLRSVNQLRGDVRGSDKFGQILPRDSPRIGMDSKAQNQQLSVARFSGQCLALWDFQCSTFKLLKRVSGVFNETSESSWLFLVMLARSWCWCQTQLWTGSTTLYNPSNQVLRQLDGPRSLTQVSNSDEWCGNSVMKPFSLHMIAMGLSVSVKRPMLGLR